MEDEHLPSFLGERQSPKDVNQTPPPASKISEEGPAPPASLQCLISHRQSGWRSHTVTPVRTAVNSPSPVPSQYLQTVRGNFKFTLSNSQHGSRFDLLHGAGDWPVIPQQIWGSLLDNSATQSTHRIIFPSCAPHLHFSPQMMKDVTAFGRKLPVDNSQEMKVSWGTFLLVSCQVRAGVFWGTIWLFRVSHSNLRYEQVSI